MHSSALESLPSGVANVHTTEEYTIVETLNHFTAALFIAILMMYTL